MSGKFSLDFSTAILSEESLLVDSICIQKLSVWIANLTTIGPCLFRHFSLHTSSNLHLLNWILSSLQHTQRPFPLVITKLDSS